MKNEFASVANVAINPKKRIRIRRHSAPADLIDLNFGNNSPLNSQTNLQHESHKSAKAIFQRIVESLFSLHIPLPSLPIFENDVTLPNSKHENRHVQNSTPISAVLSSESEKGTGMNNYCKIKIKSEPKPSVNNFFEQKETKETHRHHQVHFARDHHFIDVEWDCGGNKRYDGVKDKSNVKVRELLVLKPKWLQKDCKRVIFQDCHVSLTDFQVEQNMVNLWKQKRKVNTPIQGNKESVVAAKSGMSAVPRVNVSNSGNNNDEHRTTSVVIKKKARGKSTSKKNKAPPLRRVNQHKCELCSKSFNRESSLFQHMIVHTGEKPFQCQTCGLRFNHNSHATRHLRVHTGERPHKCQTCGKRFKRNEHLKRHVKHKHSSIFYFRTKMNRHTRTREKRFKCDDCEEKFVQKYQLKIHIGLSHTGESPYQCRFCKKPFSQSSNLNKHIRLDHCKRKRSRAKYTRKRRNRL